jgi:hypothetical protein
MKRSEMVERLKDFFVTEDWCNEADDEFATEIIDFLEQQGMQPPVYEKKTEIRMMPHNQVWTSSKPVNEWEKE